MRGTFLRNLIILSLLVTPSVSFALDFDALIKKGNQDAEAVSLTIGKKGFKLAQADIQSDDSDDFSVVLRPVKK